MSTATRTTSTASACSFRASPRQADVLIVAGTLTTKMAGPLVRLWEQMPEPKWCVAMGTCTTSGGRFKRSYSVVQGVDRVMPVDVYVPGCPPRPEGLIYGLIKLQELVKQRRGRGRPTSTAGRSGSPGKETSADRSRCGRCAGPRADRPLSRPGGQPVDRRGHRRGAGRCQSQHRAAHDRPRRSRAQVWWLGDAAAVDYYGPGEMTRTSRWSTTCTRTCTLPGSASAAA